MAFHPSLHTARRQSFAHRSFTLVEVLAAAALLSMIATGLVSLAHTLRTTAAMLQSLPELDRTRVALLHELRQHADTATHAQRFPSSFLASTTSEHAIATHRSSRSHYTWIVQTRHGVSAAILTPVAAASKPNAPSSSHTPVHARTPATPPPHRGTR